MTALRPEEYLHKAVACASRTTARVESIAVRRHAHVGLELFAKLRDVGALRRREL